MSEADYRQMGTEQKKHHFELIKSLQLETEMAKSEPVKELTALAEQVLKESDEISTISPSNLLVPVKISNTINLSIKFSKSAESESFSIDPVPQNSNQSRLTNS